MGDREAQALAQLTAGVGELRERVTGGFSKLSPTEVAYCLAGMKPGPYLLARAKYVDDETVLRELCHEAMQEAAGFIRVVHRSQEGRHMRPGTIRGLVQLAMQETIAPQLCGHCQGRGIIYRRGGLVTTCSTCGGHGIKAMPTRKRARFMSQVVDGFEREEWWQWERDANQIFDMLAEWDVSAVRHIAGRLG